MSGKVVFFDIDGTLHQGDMFIDYIKFLTEKNLLKVVLFLPFILPALALYGLNPDRRWSLNLLLWPLTVFKSRCNLQCLDKEFVSRFKKNIRYIVESHEALSRHLQDGDSIFLVSGSPEHLVGEVYADIIQRKNVNLIGSKMHRSLGASLLRDRCVCANKPKMVELKMGRAIEFDVGYTDSEKDLPMLNLCKHKYRIGLNGVIYSWEIEQ